MRVAKIELPFSVRPWVHVALVADPPRWDDAKLEAEQGGRMAVNDLRWR